MRREHSRTSEKIWVILSVGFVGLIMALPVIQSSLIGAESVTHNQHQSVYDKVEGLEKNSVVKMSNYISSSGTVQIVVKDSITQVVYIPRYSPAVGTVIPHPIQKDLDTSKVVLYSSGEKVNTYKPGEQITFEYNPTQSYTLKIHFDNLADVKTINL